MDDGDVAVAESAPVARWSADQVLALAPDAASQRAGSKLGAPGPWSEAAEGGGAVWGQCKGSGKTPYRTVVDLAGPDGTAYKCSCPSRKFPCKHALGLLLMWAGGPQAVPAGGEPPAWAGEWLAGRRERAERRSEQAAGGGASAPGGGGSDPAAARRRAERRAARITAGASELEQRLQDVLQSGLAGGESGGGARWEEIAARMVDAQAPGLAARIREVAALPTSGEGWPDHLLAQCALLHLLDTAWLSVEGLPEPLAATVRARVGLTVPSAELLADEEAVRRRDRWTVLGRHDEREGHLTTRRIWLRGSGSGAFALLLAFGAAGRSPELALPAGASVAAELVFHPGAHPLRAALAEPLPAHGPGGSGDGVGVGSGSGSGSGVGDLGGTGGGPVPPGGGADDAAAAYAAALCADPWLEECPVVLAGVVPIPGEAGTPEGWQLADAAGAAVPVARGAATSGLWRLTALSGGAPLTVFGTHGHTGFTPYTAWPPGASAAAEAVPL